jgi:hypothetical protein
MRDTLSIKLCHLPPLTPICRAANIASVQIGAGANFRCSQRPSAPASRLVVSDTIDASISISASFRSVAINLPAPLPSCAFCSDALLHGPANFSVFGTIGTLTPARVHLTDRSPRLLRATFPSFRPQSRCTPQHRFIRHDSVLRCFQASPRGRGLAAIRRRNRFVILRTDSSLPATPHPASRRRSYLQLRSCGQLRQGLPPCKWHALTGVRPPALPEAYLYELLCRGIFSRYRPWRRS